MGRTQAIFDFSFLGASCCNSGEKMALYLARAKYSNAAFKGMVDSPQDREAAARKIFEAVGMTMHQCYFSVSSAELIAIGEGTPENLAAIEMIIMATGACSEVSTLEIVDSKSMTAAMETANKVVSAYQAPNK